MIIGSKFEETVGKISKITKYKGIEVNQPVMIMRISNRNEYLAYLAIHWNKPVDEISALEWPYYYEVSTD